MDIEEQEDVTKLDILVSMLANSGKSQYSGGVHAITVRIPTVQMAWLQAFSKHSGMSLNKTIAEVLEVGIDLAVANLPKKDFRAISKASGEFAVKLTSAGDLERSSEL